LLWIAILEDPHRIQPDPPLSVRHELHQAWTYTTPEVAARQPLFLMGHFTTAGPGAYHRGMTDALPDQTTNPAIAATRQVASVPATMDLIPSAAISARRSGHIVPIPPIMMPSEPKLAKPHKA